MYFGGKEPDFTPPLSIKGTPFRKQVWDILLTIPYLLIRELFRIRDSKRIKKLVGQPFLLFPSVASGTRFRISELWT